jgi:hypothetical protein
MENKNLWNKISNLSGFGALILAVIYIFFERWIERYQQPLFVLGVVMIFVFPSAELMKYKTKKNN